MAANTQPIFVRTPQIDWGTLITTQNTAMDGTGTVVTVFTGDATEGSFCDTIRFRAAGTNIQTVARIFINNGSTNATAGNNSLFDEVTLPATTAVANAAVSLVEYVMRKLIPATYKVNITIGTTVSAGYYVTATGGKY